MTDFIIIGGGVAGISAAARLSQLGQVTVLEMETAIGYHASGRSAALFEQNYGKTSTVALNRASAAYFHDENGGILSPRGLMVVASDAEIDAFAADCARMDLPQISKAEALDMMPILNPDVVEHAAYHAGAWDIDTDLLMQNFARDLQGNGGRIVTGAAVTAITRAPNGWVVHAGNVAYEAKYLVNAAGAWADLIAEMAGITPLGLRPMRRSMARLAAPGGHDTRNWPMVIGPNESWYCKPDAGALLVSPADEDLMPPHDAYADDMVLAEGLARYQEYVTPEVTRPLATWAGLRTFAPDRELVLGRDKDDAAFFWAAGQGGYGVQTAPAASQLLADIIAGTTPQIAPDIVARLRPDRFAP